MGFTINLGFHKLSNDISYSLKDCKYNIQHVETSDASHRNQFERPIVDDKLCATCAWSLSSMHMRVVYLQSASDATFEMLAVACNGNMLKFSLDISVIFHPIIHAVFTIELRIA